MPLQTVLFQPVVLLLANKACHIKTHIHGQILVTLNVIPAPSKHEHTVAKKFKHTLAGSPPQTVIHTNYSLKSDQDRDSFMILPIDGAEACIPIGLDMRQQGMAWEEGIL